MDLGFLDFFILTEATATGTGCCSGSSAVSVAMVLVGLISFPTPEGAVQSQCMVGRAQHSSMPVWNCHSNFLSSILPFYQGSLYLFRGELPNHWSRILLQNLAHFLSSFMLLRTIHLWGWFLSTSLEISKDSVDHTERHCRFSSKVMLPLTSKENSKFSKAVVAELKKH